MIEYIIMTVEAIAFVASLIISIVKGVQNAHSTATIDIYAEVPHLVTMAEQVIGEGNGEKKLEYTLTMIEALCVVNRLVFDGQYWREVVERVLCSPQKK